jgi:hypothetical protein
MFLQESGVDVLESTPLATWFAECDLCGEGVFNLGYQCAGCATFVSCIQCGDRACISCENSDKMELFRSGPVGSLLKLREDLAGHAVHTQLQDAPAVAACYFCAELVQANSSKVQPPPPPSGGICFQPTFTPTKQDLRDNPADRAHAAHHDNLGFPILVLPGNETTDAFSQVQELMLGVLPKNVKVPADMYRADGVAEAGEVALRGVLLSKRCANRSVGMCAKRLSVVTLYAEQSVSRVCNYSLSASAPGFAAMKIYDLDSSRIADAVANNAKAAAAVLTARQQGKVPTDAGFGDPTQTAFAERPWDTLQQELWAKSVVGIPILEVSFACNTSHAQTETRTR